MRKISQTAAYGSMAALIAALAFGVAPARAQQPLTLAPMQSEAMQPDNQVMTIDDENENAPLPEHLRRQVVDYRTSEPAGTVIVDTPNTYLYLVLGNGKAMRYGIGVGRDGFTWAGVKQVSRKAEWPDWYPPSEMIARQPYLPRMTAGGPGNPLGARAMYIGTTQYRIHGTNAPSTIGHRVSSGCIRLTNEDVIDLYSRVQVGAKVVVLPQTMEARAPKREPVHQAQVPTQLSSSYAATPASAAERAWGTIRPAGLN